MHLIDTHSHIHFSQFDHDRDEMISRARATGVSAIVTLGTDYQNSVDALNIAKNYEHVYCAAGIHPTDAHKADTDDYDRIQELASAETRVVAIGETGLDFYWDTVHYEAQYANFRKMIQMAQTIDLPVVIHSRSAHRELQFFFQDEGISTLNGVMHCFEGEVLDVKFYLDLGLHISLTANITYKSYPEEVVRAIPLERLMIETDSPYIAPAGKRKTRNEPANVIRVAERLAEIHSLSVEEIAEVTTENALGFFGIGDTA